MYKHTLVGLNWLWPYAVFCVSCALFSPSKLRLSAKFSRKLSKKGSYFLLLCNPFGWTLDNRRTTLLERKYQTIQIFQQCFSLLRDMIIAKFFELGCRMFLVRSCFWSSFVRAFFVLELYVTLFSCENRQMSGRNVGTANWAENVVSQGERQDDSNLHLWPCLTRRAEVGISSAPPEIERCKGHCDSGRKPMRQHFQEVPNFQFTNCWSATNNHAAVPLLFRERNIIESRDLRKFWSNRALTFFRCSIQKSSQECTYSTCANFTPVVR